MTTNVRVFMAWFIAKMSSLQSY